LSVPKCKECKCYENTKGNNFWSDSRFNFCHGFETTNSEGYQTGDKKSIYAKDLKTSPKWCPKRLN